MISLTKLRKHKIEYLIRTLGFGIGVYLVYLVAVPSMKLLIRDLEDAGIVATTKRAELILNCGLMSETRISNAKNAMVVVVSIQGKDGQLVKVMTLDCLSESGRKLSTGLTAPTNPSDTQ